MVRDSFPDLCVSDVAASVGFYRRLLGLGVVCDHRWYAELGCDAVTRLALVADGHETVPAPAAGPPRGVLVSFIVDDATAVARTADELGAEVVVPLTAELGQRHLMVLDPDGAVVDVIEPIPFTSADRRRLAALRRRHGGGRA